MLNPPRERPIAWSSPAFFRARAVLMGAHNGAVDHCVFVVGIRRKKLKDLLPDSGFGPSAEALVHVLPVAEAFRQIAPGNACPVAIEHRFEKQAVVGCRHSDRTLPPRQQVLDPVPLVIAQSVTAHGSAPKADRLGIEEPAVPESAASRPCVEFYRVWQSGLTGRIALIEHRP